MKKIAGLIAFVVFPAVTLLASAFVFQGSDDAARGVAIELFKSLDEQQKSEALKAFDDKDRFSEVFPAVERKGLAISKLKPEQAALVEKMILAMTLFQLNQFLLNLSYIYLF
jgi:hypothetical protein